MRQHKASSLQGKGLQPLREGAVAFKQLNAPAPSIRPSGPGKPAKLSTTMAAPGSGVPADRSWSVGWRSGISDLGKHNSQRSGPRKRARLSPGRNGTLKRKRASALRREQWPSATECASTKHPAFRERGFSPCGGSSCLQATECASTKHPAFRPGKTGQAQAGGSGPIPRRNPTGHPRSRGPRGQVLARGVEIRNLGPG